MVGEIFVIVVAVVAVVFAYLCGVNDGCKKNNCFRNSNEKK